MRLLATLALLFLGITAFAQAKSNQLKTHNGHGYIIKYPATWEVDATGKSGPDLFLFSPIVNDGDGFRANVNVQIQDLGAKPIDLAAYAKMFNDQLKNAVGGQMLESTTTKIAGKDRLKMVYTMTQGAYKLKVMAHCYIKNNKAYLITYSASQTKYEKLKPAAEQMLNSFKFQS